MKFTSALKLKLIYVFRINDTQHLGCLKISEATLYIDWSQPIAETDRLLYAKYGLSDEEVVFIEGMSKPMV